MQGVPRGIEFCLFQSKDSFYWSVFLPTQRRHFKTRAEAEEALADIIAKIITKKFKVAEHNLYNGPTRDYMGGIPQLLRNHVFAVAPQVSASNKVRAVKKPKAKADVRRTAKRNKGKNVSPLRGKPTRSVRRGKRKGGLQSKRR
jgi:hypothetical protein